MTMQAQGASAKPHVMMIVASDMSLIFFRGQIRRLREAGFDVTCVSSAGPRQEAAIAEGARVVPVEIARQISLGRDLLALVRLWALLRRMKPDIVNCGTPKAGLLGGVAAQLAGVPHRLYTLHGLRLETMDGWRRRLLLLTERIACGCAHRVRAVSPSLRARAIALGMVSATRVDVLGHGSANGVDCEAFRALPERRRAAERLRSTLGIPCDAPVVGFVGRITRDKGINELERTFHRLRERFANLRLLVIGSVESTSREEGALVLRWRNDPQVVMLEPVVDLAEYYVLMDLLLLPTYREGLPNVPLEAQAMGVPVVTTDATGARDAVDPGVTGVLVPTHDADALAAAAAALLEDPRLRTEMGAAGRCWVEKNFDCKTVWRLIERDYREMLAGRELSHTEGPAFPREDSVGFYQTVGKRGFDLAVSGLLLLICLPALALLFLTVRTALGRPVIFRQVRPGKNGQPFTLMKFRTMMDAVDGEGSPRPDGERLTGMGRWLRSTSLDELPELVNVLKGEMSLVGPRPLLMEYLSLYSPEQHLRHRVRPGITGWAQVNGRNALSWQRRLELDVLYARRPAFWWDLRILARTFRQAILREGIHHEGHATMPKFRGAESD